MSPDMQKPAEEIEPEDVNNYKCRKVLAQFLAGTGNSLLVLGLGAAINVSTIVIATLSSGQDAIKATETHISWIGSLSYICQPVGSLFSGMITGAIGRKRALMVINLPTIIAWIMMWCAHDLTTLFIAIALFGLGTGLTEAPTIAYIGEICEPSLRGVIATYVSLFTSTGLFGVYLLGTILPWRKAAAVCLGIPLFTIVIVSMIPETPIWLLTKGRKEDAIKSLCWLRGWVKPERVMKEFEELERYNENSHKCPKCVDTINTNELPVECPHRNITIFGRLKSNIKDLCERQTRRPLILSSFFFAFSAFTGFSSIKPNMINIFKAFNLTVDAHWASVGVGILSIISVLLCMCLVKLTGKRPIVLTCMAGSCLSMFLLAQYAQEYIPPETSTYTNVKVTGESSTTPLVLFIILVICNATGIVPISWLIVTEIFPYRSRGNACGIVAALAYIMNFFATKTYINLETSLHIYGAFYVYSAITFIGVIYLYISLPETENKTHEEIEAKFGSSTIVFADDFLVARIRKYFSKENEIISNNIVIENKEMFQYSNNAFIESQANLKSNL